MIRSLPAALALLLLAGAAAAEPPAPPAPPPPGAPGAPQAPDGRPAPSPELRAARRAAREACLPDVQKLCASVPAGRGGAIQCLRAHASDLSEGCLSALKALRAARAEP
jgi:hypothetical protein